ncbi:YadA-like family protein [Thermomonas brevis]|uniref:YadA-like family protein n=1 Tax=Thermomonas brevis TaxID=215691 RepID=A0A7G9QXC2_9GAMM|nr:YadA-like family protein [Thermomonas brevis]QNN47997.1 YadA-like family protein [Thermomonas brevis]
MQVPRWQRGTPGAPTGKGSEGGLDNTTCYMFASAFDQYNNASGDISSAFGWQNDAWNYAASAFGAYNVASGYRSSAFGYDNTASEWETSAFGASNRATGINSSAFGRNNWASGQDSSALGDGNRAYGDYSNAFGLWSASNTYATALGLRGAARGIGSVAIAGFFDRNGNGHEDIDIAGTDSTETAYASGRSSVAVGAGVQATNYASTAVGVDNIASGSASSVFGFQSQALEVGATAIGYRAIGDRAYALSVGQTGGEKQIIHLADGTQDTDAVNLRQLNAAIAGVDGFGGFSISANGGVAKAIGDGETVDFADADPNGNLTVSRTGNTITYGFAAAPTFSGLTVGGGGASFTIVNNTIVNMGGNVVGGVADGVASTDAVNRGQLDAGLLTANNNAAAAQATANSALTAAGAAQNTANQAVSDAAAAQGTADTALTAANAAQASADAAQATANTAVTKADAAQATANTAVTKADAAQATADTALAAAGNAITTANTYTDTRETAIRADMTAGDAATLASSKTYTDTRSAQTLASANAYTDSKFAAWNDTFTQYQQQVDHRFAQTDKRIDQVGAMGSAMAAAAINTAGLPGQNRVGVGVGAQNGRTAVAIGYQRLVRPNVSVSLTGAFSGNDHAVSAGTGFSW